MKFRFFMSAMLVSAFCAEPAWATSSPAPTDYSITLTIKETDKTFSCPTGACTQGMGLANYCPSGDTCYCCEYQGTASGSAGTGTVTFWETVDVGPSEVDKYDVDCVEAYGDIEITGSKATGLKDPESIAFRGSDCATYSAFSTKNFLNGACVLADTTVYTAGGAVAQCGGFYSDSADNPFKITGKALK